MTKPIYPDLCGRFGPRSRTTSAFAFICSVIAAFVSVPCSAVAQSEHHVFLVDISGSMLERSPATGLIPIEERQQKIKNWLHDHPNASVTLISFNNALHSRKTFRLSDSSSKERAQKWVDALSKNKPAPTNLWKCLAEALGKVSHSSQLKEPIVIDVLTDRVNTEGNGSFEGAIRAFPTLQPREIDDGPGDFTLTLNAPNENRSVVADPPTGAVKASSLSNDARVGFEIQNPAVVFDGDFVQFLNKSSPGAKSYSWTIRRNPGRTDSAKVTATPSPSPESAQSASEPEEAKWSGQHWLYQFKNPDAAPHSYTVNLIVTYDWGNMESMPLTVLVQAASEKVTKQVAEKEKIAQEMTDKKDTSVLCAIISGIFGVSTTVITAVLKWREGKSTAASSERTQRHTLRFVAFLAGMLLIVVSSLLWWKAAHDSADAAAAISEKQTAEIARDEQKDRVATHVVQSNQLGQSSPGVTGVTVINSIPTDQAKKAFVSREAAAGRSYLPTAVIIIVTLLAFGVGAALAASLRSSPNAETASPLMRSLTQLREIERLREDKLMSDEQAKQFKNAIFAQIYRLYGIPSPATASEQPKSGSPESTKN